MAVLRILFTRLRTEEKLLKEAAERLGIPCELQLVSDTVFGGEPFCSQDDVVLARCVSHNQNEAVAQMLETQGIRVVNSSHVMGVCGNKLTTSCVLEQAGVPQPKYLVAFTQEGALDAVERLGYPAVCKPVSGSWGRLLAKLNDRESAEAVFEHKAMLGAIHNTFYIQEFVDKGSFDVRAFVVDGEPLCAIARTSQHLDHEHGARRLGLEHAARRRGLRAASLGASRDRRRVPRGRPLQEQRTLARQRGQRRRRVPQLDSPDRQGHPGRGGRGGVERR